VQWKQANTRRKRATEKIAHYSSKYDFFPAWNVLRKLYLISDIIKCTGTRNIQAKCGVGARGVSQRETKRNTNTLQ